MKCQLPQTSISWSWLGYHSDRQIKICLCAEHLQLHSGSHSCLVSMWNPLLDPEHLTLPPTRGDGRIAWGWCQTSSPSRSWMRRRKSTVTTTYDSARHVGNEKSHHDPCWQMWTPPHPAETGRNSSTLEQSSLETCLRSGREQGEKWKLAGIMHSFYCSKADVQWVVSCCMIRTFSTR